jgi:hypothetical protein
MRTRDEYKNKINYAGRGASDWRDRNLRSGGSSNNENKNTRNQETKSDKITSHKVLNAVGEQTKMHMSLTSSKSYSSQVIVQPLVNHLDMLRIRAEIFNRQTAADRTSDSSIGRSNAQ